MPRSRTMPELRDKLQPEPSATPTSLPAEPTAVPPATECDQGGGGGPAREPVGVDPMHSDAENFALKGFTTWESHLATRLGVTRRELATLRSAHLQEDVDFL